MRLHDSPTTSLADHRARTGHYRNVVLSLSFVRTILVIQIPCSLAPRPDAASSPSLGKEAIDFVIECMNRLGCYLESELSSYVGVLRARFG